MSVMEFLLTAGRSSKSATQSVPPKTIGIDMPEGAMSRHLNTAEGADDWIGREVELLLCKEREGHRESWLPVEKVDADRCQKVELQERRRPWTLGYGSEMGEPERRGTG